jgi:excisionase family DNA binding protein
MIGVATVTADEQYGSEFGCDGIIRIQEAAAKLTVGKRTVYNLLREGKLRKGKINRRTVVCQRSLQDYIKSLEE